MTEENLDKLLELLQALRNGKTLQVRKNAISPFIDCYEVLPALCCVAAIYNDAYKPHKFAKNCELENIRIKPPGTYKPYSWRELAQHMIDHTGFYCIENQMLGYITQVDTSGDITVSHGNISNSSMSAKTFMETHLYKDAPAGTLV